MNTSPDIDEVARLGVNVDHVATLREARRTSYPRVDQAAYTALAAGAASITLHLREDRRHIQDHDLETLVAAGGVPVNMELAATPAMIAIAEHLQPRDACLVPEKREELTTEGGLDVDGQFGSISSAVERLSTAGIQVALFIDPDINQVEAAQRSGAPAIEFHTGAYADAAGQSGRNAELERITEAAEYAATMGFQVHAGHGLTRSNVGAVAAIEAIEELNIGHAIIADAIETGLFEAVRAMRRAIEAGRGA